MSDLNRNEPQVASSNGSPARVFTTALAGVVVAWTLFAALLIGLVAAMQTQLLKETVVITLLSGLIGAASMIPGLVGEWMPLMDPSSLAPKTAQDTNGKHSYIGPLFGGMILRLIATVALFVMCRYQMAAPLQWIAAMTIGWYVVLTTTEVILLSRGMPQADTLGAIASTAVAPAVASVTA